MVEYLAIELTSVFKAYGCELLEYRSGDKFSYKARNIENGKILLLGHRTTRLPQSDYPVLARQISRCALAGQWFKADAKPGEMFGIGRLNDILLKIFSEVLIKHGFTQRESQTELTREILATMNSRGIALAEAEVGIGKTLAYLVSALLMRRGRLNEDKTRAALSRGQPASVVIATSSITLQRAIIQDYIPALSNILMNSGIIETPITASLRKGKGNYLCDRRLAHFAQFADKRTKSLLEPLTSGSLIDLELCKNLTPYVKRHICVDKNCNKHCSIYHECRYNQHISQTMRSGLDFQVANHNLLIADIMHRAGGIHPIFQDYQAVVIDEGHKFLDAARDMYGVKVDYDELRRTVNDVKSLKFAKGETTKDVNLYTERILSKSRQLFRLLNNEVPEQADDDETERFTTKINERSGIVIRVLRDEIEQLNAVLTEKRVSDNQWQKLNSVTRTLERISGALTEFARHGRLIYWLERSESAQSSDEFRLSVLRGIPKSLGESLRRDLWNNNIPIILTSGTLSVAGSFERIKKELGLDKIANGRLTETRKLSLFNYKRNALLYISNNVPFPDIQSERYISAVTDEARRLISASNGHAALLFTSYKAMDMVYEHLVGEIPYPVFRLDRGGNVAIERFKASGNGVLLATGTMWEGVNIPGDALSLLIIVKLPFPIPDPINEWERTLYDDFNDYRDSVIVPDMLVKLLQGFGRLIRSETDTGVCAILDCRAQNGSAYRNVVLNALPSCRVTSSIKDVRQFIEAVKDEAYFLEMEEKAI